MSEEQYEIRTWWEGSPLVNDMDFKIIKFDLEMKEHFRKENEEHELKMLALKFGWRF